MVKLKASTELRYASRQLKAGEQFEADEKDAKILKATGKATDDADEQPRKTRAYKRRDMVAERDGNDE